MIALLTDDAWLVMPPSPLAYQGAVAIGSFLRASCAWRAGRPFRLEPVGVNAQRAFALSWSPQASDAPIPVGVIALTMQGDRISVLTRFVDPAVRGVVGA